MRFDAQLIKEQVSLVEIFRGDGHELKKAGPGYYKTRCPFHQEDTASCVVHDKPENYFKCFGCNEGGSVFDYWMKTRGCDFNTAITALSTGTHLAGSSMVEQSVYNRQGGGSSPPPPSEELAPQMDGEVERSWDEAVQRLKEHPHRVKLIAEWRGYSTETVTWANELGLLGMMPFMGVWREAFLVERPFIADTAQAVASTGLTTNEATEVSGESRVLGERSPGNDDEEQEKALSQAWEGDGSPSQNFSGSAFSPKGDGDRRRMAATAEEGTAPKLGSGKCAGPTSASNSRVRCDVTAGETAIPVGYHVRLGPKTAGNPTMKASWRYVPTGIGNWPFVLGDVATARVLFFVEGQWDALALVDCMGWAGNPADGSIGKFPHNVAIVAMRGATSWKRFIADYVWSDDVVAFVLGDADTAGKEWMAEDGFVNTLRLRCKRVWCFYPKAGKDFNDLWKERLVTREKLAIWFRDKMKHKIRGRRNAGVTFLQFCRGQRARADAIGECARFISSDTKHRPAGRKPLKVWERYFHKYVPEQNRSAMYATWREWLRSRSGVEGKVAA